MRAAKSPRLRRIFRARREAFWHIAPERLVVGVMEARVDEPLLVACADLFTRAGTAAGLRIAPGLVEAARVVDSLDLNHIVALDASYFDVIDLRLTTPQYGAGSAHALGASSDQLIEAPVRGAAEAFSVRIDRSLVETVVALFSCAGLNLVRLDCAQAAAFNLRSFASGEAAPGDAFAEAVAADPLAAVSVAAHCETAAAVLGDFLSVPVGLALGRYGFVDDG